MRHIARARRAGNAPEQDQSTQRLNATWAFLLQISPFVHWAHHPPGSTRPTSPTIPIAVPSTSERMASTGPAGERPPAGQF